MLQLKSVEIQGFKSFPDKTVIDFSRGITAIVGPNGSGKSNIADAIRWVMGETSSKSLRGTKMEDVIFDGTKSRKPLGFARVSLILDNSDGELPLEYDEVRISRKYYRSGESEYDINANKVRLRDIQDLLRDTGLGKDGYSIIGQGTITDIISAKSQDRRFLFEEAAGISKFKFKKEETEKKLRLTHDNILRLKDISTELEDRLIPLETDAKKAKKYLELYEEKKLLDVGIWLHLSGEAENELAKTDERITILSDEKKSAENELFKIEEDIDESNKNQNLFTEEIEALRSKSKVFDTERQGRQTQILVLQNDIEHTKKNIERIEEDLKQAEENSTRILSDTDDKSKNIENCKTKIEEISFEYEELLSQSNTKNKEMAVVFENAENLRKDINQKSVFIYDLKIEKTKHEAAIISSKQRISSIEEEITAAEERAVSINKNISVAEEKLDSYIKKEDENKNILNANNLKYDIQKSKTELASTEVQKLFVSITENKSRLKMLEDMEKNNEGLSSSVNITINEAKRGILKGIHGTIASIISVDSEYTTAIETALGGGIQNIVTDDEASAKNAIFHLKNKNAGRATFLPLTSIKGKKINERDLNKKTGFLGIASDLIGYNEKYANIINFLLGRTIISDTLDNATEIAKSNAYSYRVVSLDGQTVNSGGSLTGGSVMRNIGVLSRKNEIKELSVKLEQEKLEHESKSLLLKNHETELSRMKELVNSLKEENSRIEMHKVEQKSEIEHSKRYLENIKTQIAAFEKEKIEKFEDIDKSIADVNRIELEGNAAEKSLTEVKEELFMLETKHSDILTKREDLKAKLNEKNIEIINIKNELNRITAAIAQNEEAVRLQSEKTELLHLEAEKSKLNIAEYEKRIEQQEEETKDIELKAVVSEKEMKQKVEKRFEVEKKLLQLHESEKNIYSLKERLARDIEITEAGRKTAIQKLDQMCSKLWDDYEITGSEAKSNFYPPEDIQSAQQRANELKNIIKAMGNINVAAIDEFSTVKERFDILSGQINDLENAKQTLEKLIINLTEEMQIVFLDKFNIINIEFEKIFKELFNGGEAKLSLAEDGDILEAGIEIFVAPPGKVIKNMSLLSGGEQALSAICLYFAILNIHPAAFCVLDEIEAALDDMNVELFAEYLKQLSFNTQLIAITHRRGTMEAADRLYGVTMREKGISKIITINVSEIENNLV